MTPDPHLHKVVGSIIHEYEYSKRFKVSFSPGSHGLIAKLDKSLLREEGTVLKASDAPKVTPSEGWVFSDWSPSVAGHKVTGDIVFTAMYVKRPSVPTPPPPPVQEMPKVYNCRFVSGAHGTLDGAALVRKEAHSRLSIDEIPAVISDEGYTFTGWDITPNNCIVDSDVEFRAQYRRSDPPRVESRSRSGWRLLKWLLWILLGAGLILLLLWLLRGCGEDRPNHDDSVNGVVVVDSVALRGGGYIDDNGTVRPITGDDGRLPDGDRVTPPAMGDGWTAPPIINRPGSPSIIANRLFLFMVDEDGSIDDLARDFKRVYSSDRYSIIGFDREVKLLVIQIPEEEREEIRNTIHSQIPNHHFYAFDEEVYQQSAIAPSADPASPGWHLQAIHLKEGWTYTKGSPDVRVAILDDGIQADHPMFAGRVVDAYNVYTQNNSLSIGEGHGTHVAGIAVGSDEYFSRGASGVAPNCMIMPVQVIDNGICSTTALIAGIMYAIHHDADVVNISMGPSFKGLDQLSLEQQREISRSRYVYAAQMWHQISTLAAQKNTILVFAAGNDHILSSIPPENRSDASITVCASDMRMCPSDFTNYGEGSNISAPGVSICSAFPYSTLRSFDGTSVAAPIVTGTIALMKSLKRDLTVEEALNAIFTTGADVYGAIPPMVLVDKALEATANGDFGFMPRETHPIPDDLVDGTEIAEGAAGEPSGGGGLDYEAIRRKIQEYKQRISQLERLLPENK